MGMLDMVEMSGLRPKQPFLPFDLDDSFMTLSRLRSNFETWGDSHHRNRQRFIPL